MTANLRAIVIDDEEPSRAVLRHLLNYLPNVELVGEAGSAAAGVALFLDLRPDVVLLDVQMPGGDGFSILPKLQPLPAIIFVTAYDEFAVRAFEVNAIDYLLKPVRGDRLIEALQRVVHRPRPRQPKRLREDDQIFLGSDVMRVAFIADVTGIEAEGNYSRVHVANGSPVFMRRSLTEWEQILPESLFVRVHRSLFLNHRAIQKIVVVSRDEAVVDVKGFSVPETLSRRAFTRLRRVLRASGAL